ncbi:MAG: hypothetical protein ABJL99_24165 [Aliishimia sp.]
MTAPTATSFSATEQKAMAALVGQIIPACDMFDQPGADDEAILRDILTSGSHLRDKLAVALASVLPGEGFDIAQATEFRQKYPFEAELIQTVVAQCYYRDARVMRALDIEVRAPFPDGYTQAPNDFSLLDPVRERGEIFRKVPRRDA